jgi:hypothetical protein
MSARAPRFITLDGKRHLWRDLLRLRQEQRAAARQAEQPALFELHDDHRPAADRTAASRYLEPSLFTLTGTPASNSPSNPQPTGADHDRR